MNSLMTLSLRCGSASGEYDPVLCDDIHRTLPEPKCIQPPNYCASIDAAMTLVPEGWTAWELRSHGARTRFSADISRLSECDSGEGWAHGRGKTPALALCSAALHAAALTHKDIEDASHD